MDIVEVIEQAKALLQSKGRVTYRILKRQFALDDESLEDLKEQLIEAEEFAVDKDGKMLVWTGDGVSPTAQTDTAALSPQAQAPPASYTPQHLAERIRAEQAAMESRGATDGERKTITALFADLKGSTALIEDLDPEDARAIIDPALQLMMDAVHRYDGYVAQALGDGIFALFGAPIAHEDHPQRALYAALRMQEEMRSYAEQLREAGGAPLQMRVGINTGEVVVRSIRKDDLHTDYVPVGHSTNIAARMEQLANPGSILVTAQTHKLTDGYFNFRALGKTKVKGAEEPVPIYEVTGAGPLRTRLQVSARRGLTRFVGRHTEMEQMQQALEQAKAGHGQIVGVMGEPGLGKSRLFYEFKLTSQSGCLVLEAFAVSHGKASPYLPVIELLRNYFQLEPTDEERTRKEKVGGKVLMLDRSLEDTLPYLFALLGVDDPDSSLQQMDAQIRRQRTFAALKKLFLRESLNQPVLLIFEDLHWIDTETQGFLDTLSESLASAKLALLVNYRPEYRHEWGTKTYYIQLHLSPLGQAETEELLTFLLGNHASLTALKPLILEKSEGTPFFLEEVVQTLAEEGVLTGERGHYRQEQDTTDLHIPPTVQGVLAARIDRLAGAEKELLQQLSVIGRQFPASLVKQVVSQTEDEIYRLLSSLQTKEFLYEQPAFPESEYLFKHALTQDVAYGTILHEQCTTLHERTAEAMEALYMDRLDDYCTELAHHYKQSGNTEKAVHYLHLAGQQAMQRAAHEEAVSHLTAGLNLLPALPDARQRVQQELLFQTTLGPALVAANGYAAPETGAAYSRARALCEQVGDTEQLFSALWGLSLFYMVRAEFRTTREMVEQLFSLAERVQNPTLLLEAHVALGSTLMWMGEARAAREHLEQGLALYNPPQGRAHAFHYIMDEHESLSVLALVLWMLGYSDQALKKHQEALTLAQGESLSISRAAVLFQTVLHQQFRREGQAAHARAAALITLSTEQGFPFWKAHGTTLQGWALAERGQTEEGIVQMRRGLAAQQAMGTRALRPYLLALLAEAYGKGEQGEKGLKVLAEAEAGAHRTGEWFHEAERHRFKGELLLRHLPDTQPEIEACFHKAIEIAQKQHAKSWELRAATSLARLWQQQGKQAEARDVLAPVYNWFTEGFDTKDLQEAKELLEELT